MCLALMASSAYAGVYKWVDQNGEVHFGDTPPAGTSFEELGVSNEESDNVEAAEEKPERRDSSGSAASRVTLYSASWCTICERAKNFFSKNNIAYKEYDIEKSSKGRRDFKKYNGRGVPLIIVDGNRLNGFKPSSFMRLYQRDN